MDRLRVGLAAHPGLETTWPGAVLFQRIARVMRKRFLRREDAEHMLEVLRLLAEPAPDAQCGLRRPVWT